MSVLTDSFELPQMAAELISQYSAHLGYIELDRIVFYENHNPEATDPDFSKPALTLSGLSRSEWQRRQQDRGDNVRYIIVQDANIWAILAEQQKQWLLFDILYSIDPSKNGKIRKHDVKEHACIVDFLGVHWRDSTDLPSLLGNEYPLALPPPPYSHDIEDADMIL